MGYSDSKFYAHPLNRVANAIAFGTSTGAGTASNSLAQPAGTYLPAYITRTALVGLQAICVTAPNVNASVLSLNIMNGTNTAGHITVTGGTAGQTLVGTLTNANAVFAVGGQPTMNLIGTFTASAGTSGTWDLYFEEEQLYLPTGTDVY